MRDKAYYDQRRDDVIGRYVTGEPMPAIGLSYAISKMMVKKIVDASASEADHEARSMAKYGMSVAEFKRIQAIGLSMRDQGAGLHKTPFAAYSHHKSHTRAREGVAFTMTFKEWWDCWEASGHWFERGIRSGQYVMCRRNDEGDYVVGNVYIAKQYHNVRTQKRHTPALPMGVRKRGRTYTATRCLGKTRYVLGHYLDAETAGKAFEASLPICRERIASGDRTFLEGL